jgi:hypothetical protein
VPVAACRDTRWDLEQNRRQQARPPSVAALGF